MSSVVLSKEVVETLGGNTDYRRFRFLDPVRRFALSQRRTTRGCVSCQNRPTQHITDAQLDAVLASLEAGLASEVQPLKDRLGVQYLNLPYQGGTVQI